MGYILGIPENVRSTYGESPNSKIKSLIWSKLPSTTIRTFAPIESTDQNDYDHTLANIQFKPFDLAATYKKNASDDFEDNKPARPPRITVMRASKNQGSPITRGPEQLVLKLKKLRDSTRETDLLQFIAIGDKIGTSTMTYPLEEFLIDLNKISKNSSLSFSIR